ncbi:hypothetical protein [Geobacter grbiciae]|uniref:hypothetical protein n=1 Tax=Geobacter grbiciae TaxID=155042 RepID=UPI001C03380B|nr:hypothetical protein [Geobacter grbiciae]MBT1073968.1 hypothetical protein [Geobacter grbiciae]
MESYDPQLLDWILKNLDIRHPEMTRRDIEMWRRLQKNDERRFYTHALLGFVRRRHRDRRQENFSKAELEEFIGEFLLKLDFAVSGRNVVTLPLFDIVGRRALAGFGLLPTILSH